MPLHSLPMAGGLLDPSGLLQGAGPYVLVVIVAFVFIETGLLFPFLPGDSLLFTAALLSTQLALPIPVMVIAASIAAIAGDQVGYMIGRKYGVGIFKPDARIFKTRYLEQSDRFFTTYGAKALVLARFVPIVRTFIPPIVGMSHLPYRIFLVWNAIGGIAWAVVCGLAGLWLGKIPFVANNVDLIAVVIIVISLIPIAIGFLRHRRQTVSSSPRSTPAE